MFGLTKTLTPAQGILAIEGIGFPFYIEAAPEVNFGKAEQPKFVQYSDAIGVSPGSELALPVTIKSDWQASAKLTVRIDDPQGRALASQETTVEPGQTAQVTLQYAMPANAEYGTLGCRLVIDGVPGESSSVTLPLQIVVAEKAVRTEPLTINGVVKSIPNAVPIILDKDSQIRDLVADPSTPNWAGAADLSATVTTAHDGKGLYLCIDVRDQSHHPGPASDKLWTKDSVQLAFYAGDAHIEIGLTETDGGFGWCYTSPDPNQQGKKLAAPVAVKRTGDRTVYETYLSFEMLDIKYQPMLPLRFTLLINEDDGRGRVRLLRWFDGIAAGKERSLFGFLLLE